MQQVIEIFPQGFGWAARRGCLQSPVPAGFHSPAHRAQSAAQQQKRDLGQTRKRRQRDEHAAREQQRRRRTEDLLLDFDADAVLRTGARNDHGAGNRDHQRRNHRDQTVADSQHGVGLQRRHDIHAVLQHTDQQPGHDVDAGNQDPGHRVALREPACAIHRTEEFGFARQLFAAAAGFGFVDQPGVQIGIDRHLLARQRVEREPRGDFGNTHRAMVDHDVLDGNQNQKYDGADDVVAAHHEISERLNHVACRGGSGMAVQQNQARGRDVQRQAEQRQHQKRSGKNVEVDGLRDVHRDHQHDDRHHDVGYDQQVEQEPRHRRDQRHHDGEHCAGNGQFAQRFERDFSAAFARDIRQLWAQRATCAVFAVTPGLCFLASNGP